jgi:hypothetical protein
MSYRVLRSIIAIACCSAMAIPRADAQIPELQPGARVRVQAPKIVGGWLEGTILSRSRDTVTLTTPRRTSIPVPLAAITAADVSRGRSRGDGAVKGLAWGSGVGLAVGLLSAVSYDTGSDACGAEPCDNELTSGQVVAGSFIIGAALGAGIGAIKGAEHWDSLTIQTYVAVRPSRDGVTLVLAIPF